MMKFRILFSIILFIIVFTSLPAQIAIGNWQAHLAYQDVNYAVPGNDRIYALASGALFSYGLEDHSVTTYDKTTLLSDQGISHIQYNENTRCLVIVYTDYNIDLLYDNGNVYNISSYMDKILAQDKAVNSVNSIGSDAYLCTNFGIVALDMKRQQIANTYVLNQKVYACVVKDRVIYAVTAKGLIKGDLDKNLLEASNWETINTLVYTNILLYDGHLFLFRGNDGIYLFDEKASTIELSVSGNYTISNSSGGRMMGTDGTAIIVYTAYNQFYRFNSPIEFDYICYKGKLFWGCNGPKGLNAYSLELDPAKFVLEESVMTPNSPVRNLAAYMLLNENRVLVSGGGSYTDRFNNPGTIMQYKNGEWSAFQENGISEITKLPYLDISTVAVDPMDSSHCFASSIGEGIYEFRGGRFVEHYSYGNSTLNSIFTNNPNYVRISGLSFDKSGNLWALNMGVDTIIQVRKKDGKWIGLYYPELKGKGAPNRSIIDSKGRIWGTCMMHPNGVFCIDTNGTLEDTSDDQIVFRSSYINQDGTVVSGESESLRPYALAEDKDGGIWIGTARGPLLVSNPDKWFDTNFRITQIKIPRNDGTNLADYLLAGEQINAIAVDGGNRKWFGTTNGVYLISADGLQEIHHFTMSNSPLLSDKIQSIAILPTTGEVLIGTDNGIVSYAGDATEAGESFSSDVHAYPNPVREDYTGVIAVRGLVYDTDVKIVDAAGRVVCEGRSNGGLFTWDGRNKNGDRVASGVYLVLAADSEGKEGVATKIVMIR